MFWKIWMQEGPWGSFGDKTKKASGQNKGEQKNSGSNQDPINPWTQKRKNSSGPDFSIFEDFLKKRPKMDGNFPNMVGGKRGIILILLALFVIWMLSGLYRVQPDEQGVVLRFGKWVRTDQPGLNYHLPSPIETVLLPSVTRVNRVDIGFRPGDGTANQIPEESLMLTGDENIVDINFTVFWLVKDAGAFLFNVRSTDATVKAAAESTMREIISQTPIAEAMAEGRRSIEEKVKVLLQDLMNEYQAGIEITEVQLQRVDPPSEVIDAFRDVQRARADLERLRNDAEAYRNKIIPEARGDAERIIQGAEGYKQQIIQEAEGQANRFGSVLSAYEKAPEITQKRMYLETMEGILAKTNKVIMDASQAKGGVLPYLPLDGLKPKKADMSAEMEQQAASSSSADSSEGGSL